MPKKTKRSCLLLALLGVCLLVGKSGGELTQADGAARVTLPQTMPLVAITFDDGPRAGITQRLLDGLALREVPATFFLVGECLPGNEELVRRMAREGHQIGVHTQDHVRLQGLSRKDFDQQVGKTRAMLSELLGTRDFWLRPPYGITDNWARAWSGGPIILWSVDPEDWKDRDTYRIVGAVMQRVEDGDIILLHDIYESSVDAALQIVDQLQERGFCLVTVEQLLALRGVKAENGVEYRCVPPA